MGCQRRGYRTVAAVLTLALLTISAWGQGDRTMQDSSANAGAVLDQYFAKMVEAQRYVGLGACLIAGDTITWQGSYGYADREARIPLRQDAIIQIASLSKTVTATALMQLYEKGLMRLDDDINKYMPISVRNPHYPEIPITFRMLLTHRGGFADVTPSGQRMGARLSSGPSGDSPIPLEEFIKSALVPGGVNYADDLFSMKKPGTTYEYSNLSFAVLGYLVEKIAKQDFADYCKENIFIPMGMKDTGWHLRDVDVSRVAYQYILIPGETLAYKKVDHFGVPGYPAGNLRTTLRDFSHFAAAFVNKGNYKGYQMLKPETVALMLSPQHVDSIPSRAFRAIDIGLAWMIHDIDGTALYTMNGFSGSIFTSLFFSPGDRRAFMFYYTGVSMKNMAGSIDITKRLQAASRSMQPL